jgi:hypothetical protein
MTALTFRVVRANAFTVAWSGLRWARVKRDGQRVVPSTWAQGATCFPPNSPLAAQAGDVPGPASEI